MSGSAACERSGKSVSFFFFLVVQNAGLVFQVLFVLKVMNIYSLAGRRECRFLFPVSGDHL